MKAYTNIDEYLSNFEGRALEILTKFRKLTKKYAPDSQEAISYGIPTVKVKGKNRVHYAGFAHHVSLFPASDEVVKEIPELAKYRTGKGTFQFKLNEEIPYHLIEEFIKLKLA